MSAYEFPTAETAAAEVRPLLDGPKSHLGFVPNLLLGLSNATPALHAYLDLGKHFSRIGLSPAEMQTVLTVASVENRCAYCVAAHSTFATNAKMDPAVLKALRRSEDSSDAKLNALAGFARSLIRSKGKVSESDLARFLSAGYTREQGIGMLIGLAMKTIANLGNHLMNTPLDAQFSAQRWDN
jgi:uncharacterized peroxidase-related enzyme